MSLLKLFLVKILKTCYTLVVIIRIIISVKSAKGRCISNFLHRCVFIYGDDIFV